MEQHLTQLRRSEDGRWFFPIGVARDAQGEFKPQRADHGYSYKAFLLRLSAGDMISYWFDDSAIDALIKHGALPGHMTHGENPNVFLGRISADHYKVLLSEERPIVVWQFPLVLKKLPPELDPCKKGAQVK